MSLRTEQDTSGNQSKFYTVNKHLFYYFISLYGGGPAIVSHNMFR